MYGFFITPTEVLINIRKELISWEGVIREGAR